MDDPTITHGPVISLAPNTTIRAASRGNRPRAWTSSSVLKVSGAANLSGRVSANITDSLCGRSKSARK